MRKSSAKDAYNHEQGDKAELCHAISNVQHEILQWIPAGMGIFVLKNGNVVLEYLNDGYYRMIGTVRNEREHSVGSNVMKAIYEDDRPGLLHEVQAAVQEKRSLRYRCRLLYGDGVYRWIGLRARHEPLTDGSERFYVAYFDIHDLMQTQRRLEDSESAFQELLSCSDFLYFTYYPQNHCYKIMVLPEKLKELPREMEDFPENFIVFAGLSTEDGEAFRQMVRCIDDGGREAQCDIRFCYQGSYKWYRVHMLNPSATNQRPEKVLCYAMEIGQLKEAERLLAAEKLRMKFMASGVLSVLCFNITRDVVLQVNKNEELPCEASVYESVEKEAIQQVDMHIEAQREETRKILLSDAVQIPDRAQRWSFLTICSHMGLQQAYEEGRRESLLEYRCMTSRGLCWVRTRISLLTEPETGDVLAFCYTSDINKRKIRQEVLLRLLGNGYACYIDLSTRRIHPLELNTVPDEMHMPVVDTYEEARRVYIMRFVHPKDQDRCMREFELGHILQVLEQAPVHTLTYRMQRPGDGASASYRRMEMRIFYLNEERQYLVFGCLDITEKYEQEQQRKEILEQAAFKAQSASAAKTNFLARMSHDIRTPLNGIIGLTNLALEETKPSQIQDYLQKIDESSHFLLALVNDILDMNKVESGKMELHPEPYTYPEMHQYITAIILPLAERQGVNFVFKNSRKKDSILVDKMRLNQILFNLLSNAIKFTPSGGHVELAFCHHRLKAGCLSMDIIVTDDGAGMSKEFQKKLFQPFEQEYTSRNARRQGSGLGLAIVRSLVRLMGGTVRVKSEIGKGSEFCVHLTLPLVKEKISVPVNRPKEIAFDGCRFLVADDNDINGEIVQTLLRKKGALTVRAKDGQEALHAFERSKPYMFDIILMDVQMPGMDGLEAARRIRALDRPDAAAIPVIAITANAYEEDISACLAAGMNAHIAKPIDTRVMFRTIANYLVSKGDASWKKKNC